MSTDTMHGWEHSRRPAAVLAGGLSRRFGSDKSHAILGGKALTLRLCDSLRAAEFDVCLLGDPKRLRHFGFPVFPDLMPHCGPLAAMENLFSRCTHRRILFAACDMPLLSSALVHGLWAYSSDQAITLLHSNPASPLPGVYARKVLPDMQRLLHAGRRDLRSLQERHPPYLLDAAPEELEGALYNINTVSDLERISHAAHHHAGITQRWDHR